jgi:predicted PurR-regulated permease PerM
MQMRELFPRQEAGLTYQQPLTASPRMNRPAQISYLVVLVLMALVASLHLGTFLLTALFGYLALQVFSFHRSKVLSVALYFVAVIAIGAGLIYFANLAYRTFPRIADMAIPAMVGFAEKYGIDLPFSDYDSLKSAALDQAKEGIAIIGRYARVASFQSVLVLAGLVVALSAFLNSSWNEGGRSAPEPPNAYSALTRQISRRFYAFYECFATVMGAQIIISAINTVLSGLFLIISGFPYYPLLVGLVFLCGLLPIVGNLLSNTVIVGVGFSMSPRFGIIALIFLVAIHKLEYFLNSKVIGKRIHSPVWLTLIGLVVGERLMGIPGMVLAPVVLYYIKTEMSAYPPLAGTDDELRP